MESIMSQDNTRALLLVVSATSQRQILHSRKFSLLNSLHSNTPSGYNTPHITTLRHKDCYWLTRNGIGFATLQGSGHLVQVM